MIWLRNLLIGSFIFISFAQANEIRMVTETNYLKKINGNSGMEFLIKTTIPFKGLFDLKIGLSENFTGFRSNSYKFNHCGTRFDIGVYWDLILGFQVGYTHSNRKWFSGANPKDVFINDSVDMLSIRKEFKIKW